MNSRVRRLKNFLTGSESLMREMAILGMQLGWMGGSYLLIALLARAWRSTTPS
jgi:hypothetical protein